MQLIMILNTASVAIKISILITEAIQILMRTHHRVENLVSRIRQIDTLQVSRVIYIGQFAYWRLYLGTLEPSCWLYMVLQIC